MAPAEARPTRNRRTDKKAPKSEAYVIHYTFLSDVVLCVEQMSLLLTLDSMVLVEQADLIQFSDEEIFIVMIKDELLSSLVEHLTNFKLIIVVINLYINHILNICYICFRMIYLRTNLDLS